MKRERSGTRPALDTSKRLPSPPTSASAELHQLVYRLVRPNLYQYWHYKLEKLALQIGANVRARYLERAERARLLDAP